MFKRIFIITTFHLMAHAAFSQIHPQIEKALAHPKRAENEAKADVYIHRKPVIHDSIPQGATKKQSTPSTKKRNDKHRLSGIS